MSSAQNDPLILFHRWFEVPLRQLETIPNGDGAFVAFGVSLALYERFARSMIDASRQRANDQALLARLAQDFGITESEAEVFWQVMRHGLQHQGMPMQRNQSRPLPRWLFNGSFRRPIEFQSDPQGTVLCVQPWLFQETVLRLYEAHPEMIAHSQSFPWAAIFSNPLAAQQEGAE